MVAGKPQFHTLGTIDDEIVVEITYQIIGLFSEGLYSSASKAIEELVSNSFDADADRVHVVLSHDLADPAATIAVIDNGVGMDAEGLKVHWIVGESVKGKNRTTSKGRRTIGKFGIGKLAAYVLGQRLTHISRVGDKFYSTSMDFSQIPQTVELPGEKPSQPATKGPVVLPLRRLSEAEAREALDPWLGAKPGRSELTLFGPEADKTWTAAIISDLKPMAQELSLARLRWILSTAMPLRDDFRLFLNNQRVPASKIAGKRVGAWMLGKNLQELPKPAPTDLMAETNDLIPKSEYNHWYVVDSILGPVSGYLEVYEGPIDTGKSNMLGRSNGFFVYVNGRLVNPDDAGFGIDRNQLRHGTFSRFRVVANIDRLDEELRSSRESMRVGPRLQRARELLQGIFNFARSRLDLHVESSSTARQASQRLADSPASLSERPILRLILDAFNGTVMPRHITVPSPEAYPSSDELRTQVESRIVSKGGIVAEVIFADIGTYQPIAILDSETGILSINLEHPFVAHFADEFGDQKRNLPLQLFAISEILLEAQLHASGASAEDVALVLDERDELLRHLAKSTGTHNSLTVAQDLLHAASSKKELEDALVAVFAQLGFEAVPRGGNNDSDGLAAAHLAPQDGKSRNYRVSLEAKSKETVGAKVKKKDVEIATIARHREKNNCDHAIVVGPAFETGVADGGAVVEEIDADRAANDGRSITLMNIADLARLVRYAPIRRINLVQLRSLFIEARTPSEAAAWVDKQIAVTQAAAPYKDILETIWSEQEADKDYSVTYDALRTALRHSRKIVMGDDELRAECLALARMAPGLVFAREEVVELNIKPEKVLETIGDYINQVSVEEEA